MSKNGILDLLFKNNEGMKLTDSNIIQIGDYVKVTSKRIQNINKSLYYRVDDIKIDASDMVCKVAIRDGEGDYYGGKRWVSINGVKLYVSSSAVSGKKIAEHILQKHKTINISNRIESCSFISSWSNTISLSKMRVAKLEIDNLKQLLKKTGKIRYIKE